MPVCLSCYPTKARDDILSKDKWGKVMQSSYCAGILATCLAGGYMIESERHTIVEAGQVE